MRNLGHYVCTVIISALAVTGTAAAGGGETAPSTDFMSGLPAFFQSAQFLTGIIAGAVATHVLHLLCYAGRRMLMHTFFLGQRTLHYGVAAALIGGLILLI